jgi:hypothetical protein
MFGEQLARDGSIYGSKSTMDFAEGNFAPEAPYVSRRCSYADMVFRGNNSISGLANTRLPSRFGQSIR